ncbi:hypothetical protein [Burkholderia pseudomallei]|uniref:hypothetical protein n=1 Tax=Burkholderia pseudomallei TaxID=28450 RepID=UPI0018A1E4EB|nr:hypothetical protein [Burkholderia pseudomallei]
MSALKRGGQAEDGTGAEALGQPIHGKRASRVASSALLQRAELDPCADGMRCRNVGEAGVCEIPHETVRHTAKLGMGIIAGANSKVV